MQTEEYSKYHRIYSDDSRVGKKKHNVVPIAHAYILGGKLPFENVDNSVLILDRFDRVGDKYKQRSQREALNRTNITALSMTRYPKLVTTSR